MGPGSGTGTVTDIQRFSLHDGPGIRTVVFLKGCSLRCKWCCNPETQDSQPQLGFFARRCIGCGSCAATCPVGAISLERPDSSDEVRPKIDRSLCDDCGRCAGVCPSGALRILGRVMSVAEVLSEVERDSVFYRETGGGLTLSGGEVGLQPEFAAEILAAARDLVGNSAVETCGHVEWQFLEPIVDKAETVLFDLKTIEPAKHKDGTGVSNSLILSNFRRVQRCHGQVIARVPLIPGFNADPISLGAIADFVASGGGVSAVHLLPYHSLGESKYAALGRPYPLAGVPLLSDETVSGFAELFAARGLNVRVGG